MSREPERLRKIFAEREGTPDDRERPNPETLWRAVAGELPTAELERLTDRLADDPQLAAEWRMALDLYRAQEASSPGRLTVLPCSEEAGSGGKLSPRRLFSLATAAAIFASVTGGLLFVTSQRSEPPQAIYRGQDESAIRSLVEPDRQLPRDDFVLSWTPLEEGCTYELVVSDSELAVLVVLHDLEEPRARLPAADLQSVASGSKLQWQVMATDPEGRRHRSPTFEAVVR